MDIIEAIGTRRSIRKFQDKPVSEDLIRTLLEAAMAAPSASNQQPWHFIVLTDRKKLDAIPSFHPHCRMVTQAPLAILVCGDPDGKPSPEFWVQDCGAATQNLLLAARGLGLGTVWTGVYPDPARMKGFTELLAIPKNIQPFALVPVGWPASEFRGADRFRPDRVHRDAW